MSNQSKSPKYCYFQKGRWTFLPYVDGKRGKEVPLKHDRKLIRENDPMSWVWAAWEKIVNQPSDTLGWLIDQYLKSGKFDSTMHRTKRSYRESAIYLKEKKGKTGLFGDVAFESITPGVITKLTDSMKDTPTAAKHRIQFLAAVYSWAFARDICKSNPCKGADSRPMKKGKAKLYVEDKDYFLALDAAKELESYLYPMMIIAYCCRARVGEISRSEFVEGEALESGIRLSDISDEGIQIHRSKGSLPELTLWSDFLREGFNAATRYSRKQDQKYKVRRLIKDPFLIRDSNGEPIKKKAFDSAMARLKNKCKRIDPTFKTFGIHELKAKGIDDHKNHESGHKTESAKAVYLRKMKRVESTK